MAVWAFVDGNYVRQRAADAQMRWPNPWVVASDARQLVTALQHDGAEPLRRLNYYDADPDAGAPVDPDLVNYWAAIET